MTTRHKLIVIGVILTLTTSVQIAHSQTFKADFSTKLVLASGTTDPVNTMTITSAPGIASPIKLTFPNANAGGAGYVLTSDDTGALAWVNPASGITLAGDVTGPAGTNAIAATVGAGNHIVAALNSPATAKSMNADVLNYDTTLLVSSNQLGLDLTHSDNWTGAQTFSGGLSATTLTATPSGSQVGLTITNTGTGNDITGSSWQVSSAGAITATALNAGSGTIQTTGAIDGAGGTFTGAVSSVGLSNTGDFTQTGNETVTGTSSIDASPSAGGANVIGNGTSTTALNGAVTFNGTVTLPAGSVTAASIGLADGDILIGDGSNHAAAQALTQDVTITDAGVATTHGSHAATFAVQSAETVGTTLGVSGATTLTSTLAVNGLASTNAGLTNSGGAFNTSGGATNINTGGDANAVNIGSGTGANAIAIGNANSTNTIQGKTTIGSTAFSSASGTATNPSQNDWNLSATNSYFLVTAASGGSNVFGIANGTSGRVIVLVNSGTVDAIVLNSDDGTNSTDVNRLVIPGGIAIMAPGGTATLIYDATAAGAGGAAGRWRMISGQ